ncbi:tRNA (adenosine(37)-N6)-threonylcarbamoyltransferase complex dimerization subunit type 1 TsaB [Lapidilactobacillus gannanensis]|uniref:tRNA (Adenosine(37)-N6)-threonylcarbamoyltransferase complex dimerization subunit type 1 TsaB n=1 Tax=Lapidilactobacillus gannanensis TaxID=2486002 RepID=A0ABW4BPS9_9LACO|nr:tRNA (adenosine(37)-N6)-threonylcarbamoyltransferase complex dimerization subunit type 1 TsaB [Lapidilactobacillus gannanensis]
MLTLALDTSNIPLSVAVIADQQPIAQIQTACAKNHSTTLMPAIDQALKLAQTSIQSIDRFVVTLGPGSYTGVRIAVTTAKTLAWTLAKPLYAISSLAALTTPWALATQEQVVVPLIDARRDCFFTGFYQWQQSHVSAVRPDVYLSAAQIVTAIKQLAQEKVILAGSLTSEQEEFFRQALPTKQLQIASGLAAQPLAGNFNLLVAETNLVSDLNALVPNYLRPTEAEANWLKAHPDAPKTNYVEEV